MHSLHPLTHQRGSAPTIGTRLPIPPPKTSYTETNSSDIFEDVNFSSKQRNNHRDSSPAPKQSPFEEVNFSSKQHRDSSPAPKQNPQPSWKTDSVSNRSSNNKPNRSPMPPPPKPSPLSKPPASAKPTKPKVTSPPPVSSKPVPLKNSSLDSPPTNFGLSPQNIDDVNKSGPPVSPRIKKKLPDSSLSNGNESINTPQTRGPCPPTAPKGKKVPEVSETRRKLDTSFLNKLSETTSNPPFKPKMTSPEPPTPYSPETRRKYPNDFKLASKPEHKNGPEIVRKPMPPTPKKPVLNKFQNSDLAACLQNNNPSSRRPPPGGSSHKPMAPPKPKPMLPPSYR